jgi:hypothetical protein
MYSLDFLKILEKMKIIKPRKGIVVMITGRKKIGKLWFMFAKTKMKGSKPAKKKPIKTTKIKTNGVERP